MLFRSLILIGLAVLIFVLCLLFLHFEFLSSGLWWTLFSLLGLATFTAILGRQGQGSMSPMINMIGIIAQCIIATLSFIFFWWQGGVAMIVAWILWTMFLSPITALIIGSLSSR